MVWKDKKKIFWRNDSHNNSKSLSWTYSTILAIKIRISFMEHQIKDMKIIRYLEEVADNNQVNIPHLSDH